MNLPVKCYCNIISSIDQMILQERKAYTHTHTHPLNNSYQETYHIQVVPRVQVFPRGRFLRSVPWAPRVPSVLAVPGAPAGRSGPSDRALLLALSDMHTNTAQHTHTRAHGDGVFRSEMCSPLLSAQLAQLNPVWRQDTCTNWVTKQQSNNSFYKDTCVIRQNIM